VVEYPTDVSYYSYDADGKLLRFEQDFGPDGTIDETCEVTWQNAGSLETARWECPRGTSEFDYDARGLKVALREYTLLGVWLSDRTTTYGEACNRLDRVLLTNQETTPTPEHDRVETRYTWDADYRWLGSTVDSYDDDGVLDNTSEAEVMTYDCP